ncbi:MAG: hypothetical protein VX613_05745 [Candidatus Thermoplasmatota archaeon]|nr:hypothetical protein [Candidatus Thermoplasmatota archaeon]MEE3134184.1 hypothetical protein [Candidatus Thermoplasmatota archaeon]
MEDTKMPVGFIILSKLTSGSENIKKSYLRVLFSFSSLIFSLFLLSLDLLFLFVLIFLPSISLFILFLIEIQSKKAIMNSIAVNLGHPWIEEEHDVNEAEVAYRSLEKWEVLPRKGRIKRNVDGKGLLIEDGNDELVFEISKPPLILSFFDSNTKKIETEVIKWLNLALAIRDAQNNEEDEIESARIREDDEELNVDRFWPETTPGELNVKPGAIFRKLSKGKK